MGELHRSTLMIFFFCFRHIESKNSLSNDPTGHYGLMSMSTNNGSGHQLIAHAHICADKSYWIWFRLFHVNVARTHQRCEIAVADAAWYSDRKIFGRTPLEYDDDEFGQISNRFPPFVVKTERISTHIKKQQQVTRNVSQDYFCLKISCENLNFQRTNLEWNPLLIPVAQLKEMKKIASLGAIRDNDDEQI